MRAVVLTYRFPNDVSRNVGVVDCVPRAGDFVGLDVVGAPLFRVTVVEWRVGEAHQYVTVHTECNHQVTASADGSRTCAICGEELEIA